MLSVIGRRFGRLVVLQDAPRLGKARAVLCRCDCGTTKAIRISNLSATRSCGCLRAEVVPWSVNGHGMSGTPEYGIWCQARNRCYNPKVLGFERYGGRGITMCARWNDFAAFIEDMGRRPSKHHWLDRINNDGNYEPSNCRWIDIRTQQNNRRDNRRVTFHGVTRTASEWDRHLGFRVGTVAQRIRKLGWDVARALTTPLP